MKLSVATYRASSERLAMLRHICRGENNFRRGLSLDTGTRIIESTSAVPTIGLSPLEEWARQVAVSPSESPTSLSSCAMMVEGSPPRLTVAISGVHIDHPHSPSVEDDKRGPRADRGDSASQLPFRRPERPNSISVQHQGHSRWKKLRTTVQLGGAVSHPHKKPSLKREDSFLKRFSTRQPAVAAERESTPLRWRKWVRATVLNPDESLLFWWLWMLTVCVLYNSWALIVRQAFPELQAAFPVLWYAADGCSDLVFLLDVAFQFRTGYLEQGIMVRDSRRLARHYFTSRAFVLDMLALAPLDLAQMWLGPAPLLRLPRFLKAHRTYRFYYTVESRTAYPNLWRVANLIHVLLLLAHWFGCFYYMLSELENFKGSWSYPHPEKEYSTLIRKYLGSVYWSTLTLTTIGDLATPVTNLQYLFTIISYLIGVFIFATIVGQVGNVITNRNASRLEFERLLDGAKLYMRHHKVPRGMQRRVQRWYDYSWSRGRMQGGGDIHSALGILPDKLKTELALHVNLKTLKKVTIFQECQPEFLHDLVLKMKAYIFTPGDLICRKGEVAREMFIISDGILEVINESGLVLTQMRAGDFFGEIGILNLDGFNRRTADVRSVGYSELFSLSREDVLMAMKDYPDAEEILQTMGRKRLMEARVKPRGDPSPRKEKEPKSSGQGRRIRWRSKWSKTPAEKRKNSSDQHRQMEPAGQEQGNGEDRMTTSVAKEIPFRMSETTNETSISRMPKDNPFFPPPVMNSPSADVISLSDGGAILSPPRPTEKDRIASFGAPSCPATDRRHFLFGTSCTGDEVSADTHTSPDTSWPSLQTSVADGDAKKDNREVPTAGVQKSESAKSSLCASSARSKDQPGPEPELKNNGKGVLLAGNILAKIQTDRRRNDPSESRGKKGTESESASFNACVVYGKEKVYTKDLAHLSSCGESRGLVAPSAMEADGRESFGDVEASSGTESYATCFQPSLGRRSKGQGGGDSHRGSSQWAEETEADGGCGKRGEHPPLLRENDLDNKAKSLSSSRNDQNEAKSVKRGPVFRPKMGNRRSSEKESARKLKRSKMGEIQEEKDFLASSQPHESQEPTTECVPPQHLFDGRATAHQSEELSPFTDGVQDYLIKVMRDVKQAMKIYVMEKEDELRRRISELEEQIKQKDEIIVRLQDMAAEIEPEAERDFLKSSSFGGNISNSEDTAWLSSSENDDVFPDELQKVAPTADQQPLDVASLHVTETLSQQEDSKPSAETPETCIEEPCVELEQEDLWRVEFPAFNAPILVQPSSVRKHLRRHSSVEVGTELSSYLLQDQSDSERDDCPFLKPHDQHFLARRFSESPSRPDQDQPRSFSNIVRKVFRKVKASKEAEASKSQVPVLLDTSLTTAAATSRRSSLDDNEATAENSHRAIWRQRPRRSSDSVQRPSAISGNQSLFNNLGDILTVKPRPTSRSGSEGNQARSVLRHLPTISEHEGLRRKLSPIVDNEQDDGQTPTDLASLLNPERNRDSLINHRPTSVANSALVEEGLSPQLVHLSGDSVKGGNVVIDISESR